MSETYCFPIKSFMKNPISFSWGIGRRMLKKDSIQLQLVCWDILGNLKKKLRMEERDDNSNFYKTHNYNQTRELMWSTNQNFRPHC